MTVSLDGYEISAPFGAGFDLGGLTLSGVDQIRVYRGAAAIVNGAGALTGALDLRSSTRKKPGFSRRAGVLLGSYSTRGLTVDGDFANQTSAFRVSAQARESLGDFEFIDPQGIKHTRVNNGHRRVGVMATGERALGARAKGRVTALWDAGTRGAAGPSEFQQQLSQASIEDQRVVATGRTDQRSTLDLGSLSIDTHQQVGSQWRSMTYTNPSSLLGSTPIVNTSDFSSLSGIAGAAGYMGGLSFRLQYEGTHAEYQADESRSGRVSSRIQAKRTENALAASAEYTTDVWSLMAGLRTEILSGSRDESAVLPSVGVAWSPAAWFSVRSNVARTYRAPDFDELYLDLETVRGNPNLHSERAWTMDVGPEISGSRWHAGAAYFENRMNAVILFLPVSSTVIEATNLDGVTSRGLESWADWKLSPQLSLAANYTLTRSYRNDSEDQVPHQPMHEGRVGTRISPISWLDLSAELHGHSQTNLDNFGNLKAPGWVSVDAGLQLKTDLGLSLGVSAQNLVNDRSRVDGLQQPLPGRSVYMSLQVAEQP